MSQFTLHASTKKGNRPSYVRATTEIAIPLYEQFSNILEKHLNTSIQSGVLISVCKFHLVNGWLLLL